MAIKIEDLKKVYKVKNGTDVHAIKGVSFGLPDTGMIFILGKSGCGKSTLLNVLGGLDGFDGGDITVDGKSLKNYKPNDLDRYRNDYVGFVFQENNLLEDKTVKFNIGLALELQSGKDNDSAIADVLESVELKGYAARSCNRLSGGQKQRVAIARALIKKPKLLLCDEPTGALDSETGADIFALLKELSKERLVVVVSHDRESAEKYGDRVVELKDGEIISDTAPYEATERTEEKPAEKKHGGLRILRALQIGLGYIIARPIRMAICLILCLITFTSVGVFDSIYAYDSEKTLLSAMEEGDCPVYTFGKSEKISNGYHIDTLTNRMTLKEAQEIQSLIKVKRSDIVYYIMDHNVVTINEIEGSDELTMLVGVLINAGANCYVETDESFLKDYNLSLVAGKLPETDTEVALPLYVFNFFKTYGYRGDDNELVKINSFDDLLGKTVTLVKSNLQPLKVSGIIDTRLGKTEDRIFLTEVIHNVFFVRKGFNEFFRENYGDTLDDYIKDDYVKRVIAPFEGSRRQKLKNLRIGETQYLGLPVGQENNEGACYYNVNHYAYKIDMAQRDLIDVQSFIIFIILGMVIIAALFVMYYASGTIDEKRREMGILRAVGASRGDVIKIIGCEHGVFTAAAVAVSSVISFIIGIFINNIFVDKVGLPMKFVGFGMRQFGIMLAVAVLAVVVGILIPVIKLLKKKPVDVIADRK